MAWIIDVGSAKSLGIVFPSIAPHKSDLAVDERTARSDGVARDRSVAAIVAEGSRRAPTVELHFQKS